MNKINIILSTACALTFINNSFGMLIKAKQKINRYKNIKASVHTKQPQYVCSFNVGDQEELLHKIIEQNKENNDLVKDNNKLLKENNLLLRTIAIQNYMYNSRDTFANKKELHNYLYERHWHSRCSDSQIKRHEDVLEHYHTLRQQHGIDITQVPE